MTLPALETDLGFLARRLGLRDAGEPFADRLARARRRRVRVVIARACDGMPLVASAQRTAERHAEAIVRALAEVTRVTAAEKALVAVERRAEAAASALRAAGAEVVLVPDVVGAADAHALAADVAGLPVFPGADPVNHGVLVVDVEVLVALAAGAPVTEVTVTVAGAVARPAVRRVPIGTTVEELVAHAGGASSGPAWIALDGGPLAGRALDRDAGVGRETRAVFVADAGDALVRRARLPLADAVRRAQSACEGCGQCADVCPARLGGGLLRPDALIRGRRDVDLGAALECSACGLCDLVCPVGLAPHDLVAATARAARDAYSPPPPSWSGPRPSLDPARGHRRVSLALAALRLGLGEHVVDPPFDPTPVSPTRVVLALGGAVPLVAEGARVTRGARLADGVHASIDGVVDELDQGRAQGTAVISRIV